MGSPAEARDPLVRPLHPAHAFVCSSHPSMPSPSSSQTRKFRNHLASGRSRYDNVPHYSYYCICPSSLKSDARSSSWPAHSYSLICTDRPLSPHPSPDIDSDISSWSLDRVLIRLPIMGAQSEVESLLPPPPIFIATLLPAPAFPSQIHAEPLCQYQCPCQSAPNLTSVSFLAPHAA